MAFLLVGSYFKQKKKKNIKNGLDDAIRESVKMYVLVTEMRNVLFYLESSELTLEILLILF